MRNSFLIAFMVTLLVAGTYWYKSSASECPVPLAYRLGEIDESFSLSNTEAREYISRAEALWENAVGRDLFVYDESAEFTIDFVFDERQAIANSEAEQREALDEQREQNESVLRTVESVQAEYDNLSTAYKVRVSKYEKDLAEYNAEVNRYNDRGGAPSDVFKTLEKKRIELNKEVDTLSKLANDLNELVAEINRLGEKGNELVEEYNQGVSQYNNLFGFAREFTQGDYQGSDIHIYKFSSDNELVTVLAHEFGHALGIDHVEDNSALMYYLLEDTNEAPTLSDDDLTAYQAVCGLKESFEQKVRRTIRELLTKFK